MILDYDYTFTTPYCGSETIETDTEQVCAPYFSFDVKLFPKLRFHVIENCLGSSYRLGFAMTVLHKLMSSFSFSCIPLFQCLKFQKFYAGNRMVNSSGF